MKEKYWSTQGGGGTREINGQGAVAGRHMDSPTGQKIETTCVLGRFLLTNSTK